MVSAGILYIQGYRFKSCSGYKFQYMKTILELLVESLSKTKIFEMAYSRHDYLYRIMCLNKQIVENWCLIKYCNLDDIENYNRLHWSNELISHMENLCDCSLKKGLNKLKVTEYGFIYQAELDDDEVVYKLLYRKWKNENLPQQSRKNVSKLFVNELPKICKLIADGSVEEIENYVYNEL